MSDPFDPSRRRSSAGSTASGGVASSPPGIDYPMLVQDAMRKVVRDVLGQVADLGLPGDHHFYISFASTHPGVGLSVALRSKHPEEMTIVLQHDFRDLEVDDEGFDVTLRFGGTPQSVRVPFAALTAFLDPAVHFMLRFGNEVYDPEGVDFDDDAAQGDLAAPTAPRRIPTEVLREADTLSREGTRPGGDARREDDAPASPAGEVVSFEAFRRK